MVAINLTQMTTVLTDITILKVLIIHLRKIINEGIA